MLPVAGAAMEHAEVMRISIDSGVGWIRASLLQSSAVLGVRANQDRGRVARAVDGQRIAFAWTSPNQWPRRHRSHTQRWRLHQHHEPYASTRLLVSGARSCRSRQRTATVLAHAARRRPSGSPDVLMILVQRAWEATSRTRGNCSWNDELEPPR
jgi:hypothetical protein